MSPNHGSKNPGGGDPPRSDDLLPQFDTELGKRIAAEGGTARAELPPPFPVAYGLTVTAEFGAQGDNRPRMVISVDSSISAIEVGGRVLTLEDLVQQNGLPSRVLRDAFRLVCGELGWTARQIGEAELAAPRLTDLYLGPIEDRRSTGSGQARAPLIAEPAPSTVLAFSPPPNPLGWPDGPEFINPMPVLARMTERQLGKAGQVVVHLDGEPAGVFTKEMGSYRYEGPYRRPWYHLFGDPEATTPSRALTFLLVQYPSIVRHGPASVYDYERAIEIHHCGDAVVRARYHERLPEGVPKKELGPQQQQQLAELARYLVAYYQEAKNAHPHDRPVRIVRRPASDG